MEIDPGAPGIGSTCFFKAPYRTKDPPLRGAETSVDRPDKTVWRELPPFAALDSATRKAFRLGAAYESDLNTASRYRQTAIAARSLRYDPTAAAV